MSNVCEVNIDGMNKTRPSRESKQFSVIKDSGNSERWGNVSTNEIAIVGASLEDIILQWLSNQAVRFGNIANDWQT